MDWTVFTLVIPVAKWAKKQFDITTRERRVLAREKDIDRREKEIQELIDIRDFNIKHISDLVFLKAERVDYRLGRISNIANIYVLVTNGSIFDVTLHKLIVRPKYEAQELSDISQLEERKIGRQSAVGFEIKYDLQLPTAELITQQLNQKQGGHWQLEMHGYFHSEIGDFEKSKIVHSQPIASLIVHLSHASKIPSAYKSRVYIAGSQAN